MGVFVCMVVLLGGAVLVVGAGAVVVEADCIHTYIHMYIYMCV